MKRRPTAEERPTVKGEAKRPYQRPRVLFRQPLEALATVCQPSPPAKGDAGICPSGPISS